MESVFRSDLVAWLRSDTGLSTLLNAVQEEAPSPAPPPALSIAASASADWSSKTTTGREVRLALELLDRGDDASRTAQTVRLIEQRIATLSPDQGSYRVVSTQFLRSRAERRPRSVRAVLLEYRFRLLSTV